ncbi:uncharacterized protein B0H18DRAFT_343817 [Fomitopsis serialis]|uniref:uncharacterized protein n=1 Tax=Fomitopsis serialis TaxID=139415 RepID=UPI002007CCFC|nr:uncharacterized protein B0H18DRAFT_343817 [Neoantrodia serialis]KAH9926477.1 hypothetical protein B0H18DRAFT_343817 [Neoantrodia serialis]
MQSVRLDASPAGARLRFLRFKTGWELEGCLLPASPSDVPYRRTPKRDLPLFDGTPVPLHHKRCSPNSSLPSLRAPRPTPPHCAAPTSPLRYAAMWVALACYALRGEVIVNLG